MQGVEMSVSATWNNMKKTAPAVNLLQALESIDVQLNVQLKQYRMASRCLYGENRHVFHVLLRILAANSPTWNYTHTLHGTAIYAYIDPSGTTPGLIGSPMAVPCVVSGIEGGPLEDRFR